MYNGITIPEIVQALSDRMEDLVCALGLEGRVDNNDFVAYNPTRQDNHLGSFRICIRGAKRGIWQEFAGSDKGDALELINYCRYGGTKDKTQAIRWARNFLGMNAMNRAELRRLQMQSAERRRENAIREMNDRQQKKNGRSRFSLIRRPVFWIRLLTRICLTGGLICAVLASFRTACALTRIASSNRKMPSFRP